MLFIVLLSYSLIQITNSIFRTCTTNSCPDTLICTDNDDDCTLVCDGDNACTGKMTYYCTGSSKLCQVQCINSNACKEFQVISTTSTTIICDGTSSCSSSKFNMTGNNDNHITVNMTCNGQYACDNAEVSLYGSAANNNFNLFCLDSNPKYWSCRWVGIYCYFSNAQCAVECETNDAYSCDKDKNELFCFNNGIDTTCNIINTFPSSHIGFEYGITFKPSFSPTTGTPTIPPSTSPSVFPTTPPSNSPFASPTIAPSNFPSALPIIEPSNSPSASPTSTPSNFPSVSPTIPPSNSPSASPTIPPSNSPSASPNNFPFESSTNFPSALPSNIPSALPTIPPSNVPSESSTNSPSTESPEIVWIVVSITSGTVLCILICIIWAYNRYKKKKKINDSLTQNIKNPMVICLAIGLYDENYCHIDEQLKDLIGVETDIVNVVNLFGRYLNYDTFPQYNVDDIGSIKIQWTLEEVMTLLHKQSNILDQNLVKYDEKGKLLDGFYDGLIVVISGHGDNNNMFTSDYRKINQAAMHRLFTAQNPSVRDIPRLFIYDCCAGSMEHADKFRRESMQSDQSEQIFIANQIIAKAPPSAPKRYSSNVRLSQIHGPDDDIWCGEDQNPDYNLSIINASNEGFQSKMRSDTGSYLIRLFMEKIKQNINDGNEKFLFEIFDVVQSDPELKNKQLPEAKFNNKTRYIKFRENKFTNDIKMIKCNKKQIHVQLAQIQEVEEEKSVHDVEQK